MNLISYNDEEVDDTYDANVRRLWCAVIIQSLIDATDEVDGEPQTTVTNARAVYKQQAQAWFTASAGVTADNFESVCMNAGFAPELVRDFYRANSNKLTKRRLTRLRDTLLKAAK